MVTLMMMIETCSLQRSWRMLVRQEGVLCLKLGGLSIRLWRWSWWGWPSYWGWSWWAWTSWRGWVSCWSWWGWGGRPLTRMCALLGACDKAFKSQCHALKPWCHSHPPKNWTAQGVLGNLVSICLSQVVGKVKFRSGVEKKSKEALRQTMIKFVQASSKLRRTRGRFWAKWPEIFQWAEWQADDKKEGLGEHKMHQVLFTRRRQGLV